ncbi:MAG: NADH-quinone oxidoreductase subunit NuoF [Planctomycetota bacterium]|jgi:NADH-quinone oxidoreductase subunit F|nr:NADH-quinone oxidoreductase subunit NuoF [Planctomycetota bacterium]MDP6837980.1 NADH-quinone oxidoreductase subunit NuoF [Planctomycetota bacterium]MDP6955872.1 NADH-quinone oxidoreductase subunit NuoF [Planctomycetota bacterium]
MSGHETYLLDRTRTAASHTLEVYRASGGYQTIERVLKQPITPLEIIDEMKASGLRGRGGAGFPTGLKWSFMPDRATDQRPRYMAVNADESEPGTCKDRVLMEEDPHGLLEGCLIAAWAMGLEGVYIYIRGEYLECHRRMQGALDEARAAGLVGSDILGSGFSCEINVHPGAGAYICGEETGLMESLEGKRGHPRPKPPFPAGFGLWGNPTTVNNVESIFNVPFIIERGAEWFKNIGVDTSPGNFLCGISGHVEKPGVYELPLGLSAKTIVEEFAGGVWQGRQLKAWIPGGSSTGFVAGSLIDTPMDHNSIKAIGSMFGTGAMVILDETACIVEASLVLARFYEHESCGQCSQCREGTQWLTQILARLESGAGTLEDVDMLEHIAGGMTPGKTICALSDAAAIPLQVALSHFRGEFEAHAGAGCCPVTDQSKVPVTDQSEVKAQP